MAAAAHTKGGAGGVPQNVGKEFNDADKNKGGQMAKLAKALRRQRNKGR